MFIGPADDLEEQFGSCLGEGNVSKFINHQEMESLESRVRNETRMLGSERVTGDRWLRDLTAPIVHSTRKEG
jgi:hypothetical protein